MHLKIWAYWFRSSFSFVFFSEWFHIKQIFYPFKFVGLRFGGSFLPAIFFFILTLSVTFLQIFFWISFSFSWLKVNGMTSLLVLCLQIKELWIRVRRWENFLAGVRDLRFASLICIVLLFIKSFGPIDMLIFPFPRCFLFFIL